ncbi:PAS domain S-box-containing protein/diguanylate cyclase (GGDEF) domain-containing protein [Persephonella hydrogeniphila]|uniref:PAS domain S-box-containing protein/diguanylate cyclase (GGDEF) domain-containing protein n=1 Tax=Persephonella hydrogeniphila TaxID=198703 RepID=A0A285N5D0_9AQUI|nr:EAL domain-containing protein [Persephonella hydrogeniphila]SNZ02931.1 PAS domain S-box-containing protein/diguanylate cyclase (GGDEF) domain-containing protein [Persephonella hydrogeniphila]
MSIRRQLILIFSIIFLVGFLATTIIFNGFLVKRLKEIELFSIKREFATLSQFLDNHIRYISSVAENEAYWDNIYNFVNGKNPEFVKKNFDPENETLKNLGIDFFVVFNKNSEILFNRCIQNRKICKKIGSVSTKIVKNGNEKTGFIRAGNYLFSISVKYILPTNELKEPAGFLVVGKLIDKNFFNSLLKDSYFEVKNEKLTLKKNVFTLKEGKYILSIFDSENDSRYVFRFSVQDIFGKIQPAFDGIIHRVIWENAKTTLLIFQIFLIAIFTGLFIVTFYSMEKLVSEPINRLIRKIKRIKTEKDFPEDISEDYGSKDINLLSSEIQEMVNRINELFQQLSEKNQIFKVIAENTPIGIYIFSHKFEFINRAFEKISGYSKEEILGKDVSIFLTEVDEKTKNRILEAIDRRLKGEQFRNEFQIDIKTKDGKRKTVLIIANTIFISGKPYGLGIAIDITEIKNLEKRLIELIEKDSLTGLYSRYAFTNKLREFIDLYSRDGKIFFLLFLDLNNFKKINDSFGHAIGDKVLQIIAERLKSSFRKTDIIGRLGGDEFGILITTYSKFDDIKEIIKKLFWEIEKPVKIENSVFNLTTSVGVAVFPEDGTDAETLLKRADIAMYQAKELSRETGKSEVMFFSKELERKIKQKIEVEGELKKAIENNPEEFYLEYQPIVDLKTLKIEKLEALIRWNSSKFGKVYPDFFIPIAEETGMIKDITDIVIDKAVSQLQEWKSKGIETKISVNISPSEFKDKNFVDRIKTKIPEEFRNYFALEITENVLFEHTQSSIDKLKQLTDLGIEILLDDFGTGYSSLTYLKKFPITTLKIDRAFVKDIPDDKENRGIVMTIIKLARLLVVRSLAEGIETKEQLIFLRKSGCQYGQGYYFSKPKNASEIEKVLKKGFTDHEQFD